MVVRTSRRPGRTERRSSIRCGNGNAGASTSRVAARRRATPRDRALGPYHPPSGRADQQPVDRQAVAVGVQPTAAQVDVDPRRPGSAARPAGSPTARAAAARACARRAARRDRPAWRGTRGPSWRSDTPVMPRSGRKVAVVRPARSLSAGSPRQRVRSTVIAPACTAHGAPGLTAHVVDGSTGTVAGIWTLAVDPVPWARAQMAFTLGDAHHPRAARRRVGLHGAHRELPGHQEATTPTRSGSPSAGRSTWQSRSRSVP